ncbi:hypothetical protein AX16_002177 [Volvariella volvacea WC 439]|nr:hypothetical protein AX16_002177 [Volvariella volvacea WC 439]
MTTIPTFARPRRSYNGLATTSPIDTLPVELLSYIFVLSTQTENASDRRPLFTSGTVKAAGVVCQVSRRWREIALNTPSLWANICVTIEMVGGRALTLEELQNQKVDTSTVELFLRLSRNVPLNILIDIRDPNWDFYEPGVANSEFQGVYPPFTPAHMLTVMSLLRPHVHRWRSVDVLSDLWSPLHTAFTIMNELFLSQGAPMLESLTLMRCNEYASFLSDFQPEELHFPAFLDSISSASTPEIIFPRLRDLCLWGVHANWSSLSHHLSKIPGQGLSSLILADHCHQVLPSISEFHQLLSSVPRLHALQLTNSGPAILDPDTINEIIDTDISELETVEDEVKAVIQELGQVQLSQLKEIKLGYRTTLEAMQILSMVDAGSAKKLELTDGSDILDVFDVDAGRLLVYLGTGAYLKSSESVDSTAGAAPSPPFPFLEDVSLIKVKSCPQPFQILFSNLKHLKRLELSKMGLQAAKAVFPQPGSAGSNVQIERRHSEDVASPLPSRSVSSRYASPGSSSSVGRLETRFSTPGLTHSGHTTPSGPCTPSMGPIALPVSSLPSHPLLQEHDHGASDSTYSYPCPHLESLQIHNLHNLQTSDMQYILNGIALRQHCGMTELKDVDIHVGVFKAEEEGSMVVDVGNSDDEVSQGEEDSIMDITSPLASRRPSAMSVDGLGDDLMFMSRRSSVNGCGSRQGTPAAKTRVRVTKSRHPPDVDSDSDGEEEHEESDDGNLELGEASAATDRAWVPGIEIPTGGDGQMTREEASRVNEMLLEWVRSRRMWD